MEQKLNIIYNEDCLATMKNHIGEHSVNVILTSPPYNMTKRKGGYADTGRYDVYTDWKTEEEYCDWTCEIFNEFHNILAEDGVVLYNFSYSIENPSLPYKLVTEIERNTDFRLIDTIVWKKKCGLPFPANKHRLSRIFEYVFAFTDKEHMNSYSNNRKVKSVSEKTGQSYYETYHNFIESPNNDGHCKLNQATFSTDFVTKLLNIYCDNTHKQVVYDPFMGTGTTAVAVAQYSSKSYFIGSEISEKQCEFANKRLGLVDLWYNGHEYVDLGLPSGNLWAKCNVGASSPEQAGRYFQWGDTQGYYISDLDISNKKIHPKKKQFTWGDYKFSVDDNGKNFTKYRECNKRITLDPEDDAARANMGGSWKMPSFNDYYELMSKTNNKPTRQRGVFGWEFTSKVDPTKSIFLPVGGFLSNGLQNTDSEGDYWTSSCTELSQYKWCLRFYTEHCSTEYGIQYSGKTVRGVCNKIKI